MVICVSFQVKAWQELQSRHSNVKGVNISGVQGIKTRYQRHVPSVGVLTGILLESPNKNDS